MGRYTDTRALTVVWANVSASSPSDQHRPGACVVSSLWYLAGVRGLYPLQDVLRDAARFFNL